MSPPTDDQLLDRAREAAAGDAPSPFEARRALHELNRTLDREAQHQRRALRPRQVALIAAVAAFSGAAVAYTFLDSPPAPAAPVAIPAPAPAPAPAPEPPDLEPAPAPTEPEPASPAPRPRRAQRPPEPKLSECAAGWVEVAAARAAADRPTAAAEAWVQALCGPGARVAADALQGMVREGTLDSHEVTELIDAQLRAAASVEGRRLPCSFGLRYDGSAAVLDRCDAFFEAHPDHPAVRELALAVGVVAERNGLEARALAAYDRAITLGAGSVVAAPALLRRAKLRLRQGDRAAARADLELYLDARPDAAERAAVRALREQLGL